MNTIFMIYNSQALIVLVITALLWSSSHVFLALNLKNLDYLSRGLGFIGLVVIFILSGLKGGLIALPIVIIFSFLGAMTAKKLMAKSENNQ